MQQTQQSYAYPSQMSEEVDGILFSSCFDSGNLGSVKKDFNIKNKYVLTIREDSGLNGKNTNYKTWFYFSVLGVKTGTMITFMITNMNNQTALIRDGMTFVYRQGQNQWQRLKFPVLLTPSQTNEGPQEVTFRHQFDNDLSQETYFAFTYPWSVFDNETLLSDLQKQAESQPEIYFNRSTLIQSREGRKVELVTITSSKNIDKKLEAQIPNLFPDDKRPNFVSNKRYLFISARVHPGEVPSSHVMNGLLKYLMSYQDVTADIARENFVWVLVPLINPDGVYRGHYRTDPWCQNLNRYYEKPSLVEQPSVYAIREYVMRLHSSNRLYGYIDLHAHAAHKGIFIYGNALPNVYMHTLNCLFPKLLSLYSEIFDYEGCNFTEKNMHAADRSDGLSKDGAGRVALYKATNIVHCYTLECNYNTGRITNNLPQETFTQAEDIKNSYGNQEYDQEIVLSSPLYSTIPETYSYRIYDYEDVGKSIALAFLDMNLLNVKSRLPLSQFKTLENLKLHLAQNIMKQMPYRFDPFIRKVIKNLNQKQLTSRTLQAFKTYVDNNEILDQLEGDQQVVQLTRYQKAQELKKKKAQIESNEDPQSNFSQEKQNQTQTNKPHKQLQQAISQKIPKNLNNPKQSTNRDDFNSLRIKFPLSEIDLDTKKNIRNPIVTLRAKSEGRNSRTPGKDKPNRSIVQSNKQFRIKKGTK